MLAITQNSRFSRLRAVPTTLYLIEINASDLKLINGVEISSNIKRQRNADDIFIMAEQLILNQSSGISSNNVLGNSDDINLNLKALFSSYNRLILGGDKVDWQLFVPRLNVIQVASETGSSGTSNVISPQFDMSASVIDLDSALGVKPTIDINVCQNSALPASSLKQKEQGGIPVDEAEYGFIQPVTNDSANSSSITLAHATIQLGGAYPCANLQP